MHTRSVRCGLGIGMVAETPTGWLPAPTALAAAAVRLQSTAAAARGCQWRRVLLLPLQRGGHLSKGTAGRGCSHSLSSCGGASSLALVCCMCSKLNLLRKLDSSRCHGPSHSPCWRRLLHGSCMAAAASAGQLGQEAGRPSGMPTFVARSEECRAEECSRCVLSDRDVEDFGSFPP